MSARDPKLLTNYFKLSLCSMAVLGCLRHCPLSCVPEPTFNYYSQPLTVYPWPILTVYVFVYPNLLSCDITQKPHYSQFFFKHLLRSGSRSNLRSISGCLIIYFSSFVPEPKYPSYSLVVQNLQFLTTCKPPPLTV